MFVYVASTSSSVRTSKRGSKRSKMRRSEDGLASLLVAAAGDSIELWNSNNE